MYDRLMLERFLCLSNQPVASPAKYGPLSYLALVMTIEQVICIIVARVFLGHRMTPSLAKYAR